MDFKKVLNCLNERFPTRLAEKWDNVGLLVEPTSFAKQNKLINKIMLTNDLTEPVIEEAIQQKTQLILSYHPPIFTGLKRLTTADIKEKIIISAIENQIAIYSPHTSADCVKGGVNDWLASCLKPYLKSVEPIQKYHYLDPLQTLKVVVFVPKEHLDKMRNEVSKVPGVATIGNYTHCTFSIPGQGSFLGNDSTNPAIGSKNQFETVDEYRLEFVCSRSKLSELSAAIYKHHPYETPAWEMYPLEPLPVEGFGMGRFITLNEKIPLNLMVQLIKKYLNLPHLRVAIPHTVKSVDEVMIQTVALCAGSGGSIIMKSKADLYWTGEMKHHEVLEAISKGTSVILCEHSNTERGYLAHLKDDLDKIFNNQFVEIVLSRSDVDPLVIV